jgi:eukaryotic-like serine/threonine-protein kinase
VSSGDRPRTRTLAGRYRLDEVIGRGGMSTVYRGTDLALDREVAVKVALDPLAEENPVYVARFKREARAAASFSRPGVVTVYDAGADGPTRYIVMELVDGQNLSEVLRAQEPDHRLAPARAAWIAEQIADTLAAAQAAGVVHRDIKPANVMITPDDQVKLLDFGIARTADGGTLTQAASVLGTAPYMAPEQAMGNPADARSDIYSLGCVLYEMLTGRPPFVADLPDAVLHQQVRVQPKPPRERNPGIPPALDALVLQMLAKNPDDRPQTAGEVRDRLAAFLSGNQTAPTAPIAPVPLPVQPPTPPPATEATIALSPSALRPPVARPATVPPPPTPPARKRGSGVYVALAVIALALIGAAVAYAIAGGGSSTPSSTAAQSSPRTTTHVSTHTHTSSTPASHPTTSTTVTTTTETVTASSTPTSTSTPTTTSTPATTTAAPPGQGGTPPGQDGTPPGQATGGTTP